MAAAQDDNPLRRVTRAVTSTKWTAKAREAAASLKAQHAAGRDGDETPAVPIWPTPKEQLDALKHLFHKPGPDQTPDVDGGAGPVASPETEATVDADAKEVAAAMRRVDWTQVRAATSERATDMTHTMRSLAEQVDWVKVQPVAAQVSSALIAAVAAGRIPVGGRLGPMVAKAITDQNNLAKRIAVDLQNSQTPMPPDFRGAIEATATES
jgi:hypothetical protein